MANKKLGNYLWYAIGEIFLVVAGILIALQINNWNEERIEQKQIREYALSLVGDLQRDIEMLVPVNKQIEHLIRLSNELADYMRGRSLADINSIDLYVYTRNPLYRPFEWNRAALEQLKSSGALRQIRNQQLAKKISEYDALTKHLDQDYANLEVIVVDDGSTDRTAEIVREFEPRGVKLLQTGKRKGKIFAQKWAFSDALGVSIVSTFSTQSERLPHLPSFDRSCSRR